MTCFGVPLREDLDLIELQCSVVEVLVVQNAEIEFVVVSAVLGLEEFLEFLRFGDLVLGLVLVLPVELRRCGRKRNGLIQWLQAEGLACHRNLV